jgi:alpha 1,2-mannosyltransferase
MTLLTLHMIRFSGCNLPVQLWSDSATLKSFQLDALTTFVDMDEFLREHPLRIPGSWEWKAHAIMHSGFAEVLYLDIDAYPVQDPTPLFELLTVAPFVFWEDLHCCKDNIHWPMFGIPQPKNGITFQGGVGLFDVKACWKMLSVYAWLNWHSDWVYSHGFGDQDACLVATIATGLKYKSLGMSRWLVCAFTYRHKDSDWFVHRCRSKFFIGGLPQYCHRLPIEDQVFDLWGCIDEGYAERRADYERKQQQIDPRKVRRAILNRRKT